VPFDGVKRFQQTLYRYGVDATLTHHVVNGRDERGQPVTEDSQQSIKVFFHVNTGDERLVMGQHVIGYDAYALTILDLEIDEGDELEVDGKEYTVNLIVPNRTHQELHLKRVKT
jgi:phage head-tail adaptor, putative, SPP1 family